MSGHHPPSWNHLPMQVPPYIPRQLPMAHMSNERPMSGPWHNSGGVPTGPPPQNPGGHVLNPEHNQYPYLGSNNRKHTMDMNPMLPPSQYGGRHPMAPNNDYDSPMMDLSVSRNNHQQQFINNTSPRDLQQHLHPHHSQDYSNNKLMKESCGNPGNGSMGDGFPNDIEMLSRRQNPVGLPPMADAMELVKEALLNKMKSQVPSISDLGAGLINQDHFPEPLSECVNLSVDGKQAEAVKESSRRKTRKPNKTSKVVNNEEREEEEPLPLNATRGGELEDEEMDSSKSSTAGGVQTSENKDKEEETQINHSPTAVATKRHTTDSSPMALDTSKGDMEEEEEEKDEVAKKKRRNRRSNDTEESPNKTSTTGEADTPISKSNGGGGGGGGGESHNGQAGKEVELPPPADPDTSFEDVENKLTELFAGIADSEEVIPVSKQVAGDRPTEEGHEKPAAKKPMPGRRNSLCLTGLSALIGDVDLETDDDDDFCLAPKKRGMGKGKGGKRPAKKGASNHKTNGANSAGGVGGGKKGSKSAAAAKKKKKGSGSKWDDDLLPVPSKKQPRDTEEGRYRGPLLQVRQDGGLNVLNGPQGQAEDDPDARNGGKSKKFLHNGAAERNKVIRGLHTNTLSMKYDTDRTDTTWICVLCKLGPHKLGLGDLFGPYMATTDCDEFRLMEAHAGDLFKSNRSRLDMVQSAPHRLPAVPASGTVTAAAAATLKSPNSKLSVPGKRGPKKKLQPPPLQDPLAAVGSSCNSVSATSPVEDLYLGLTKATDTSYEIWMHEDCIVWGSGIHMIAGRLVGVEDAVWGSTSSRCGLCRKAGAVVCCLQRGCSERVHFPCGRQSNWTLDEGILNSYCQLHGRSDTVAVGVASEAAAVASCSSSSGR